MPKQIILRLPDNIGDAIDKSVAQRKTSDPKYSRNDWLIAAVILKLETGRDIKTPTAPKKSRESLSATPLPPGLSRSEKMRWLREHRS